MNDCPVCLGSGFRFAKTCAVCDGAGFNSTITVEELIQGIKDKAIENGYKVKLEEKNFVQAGTLECSGYFDNEGKVIAAATKSPSYPELLVHEFCHLKQLLANSKRWDDASRDGDVSLEIEGHLEGKKLLGDEDFEFAIDATIELEWECEKMTMAHLARVKDYCPLKLAEYSKTAFLYMRFYRAVQHFKSWYKPGKSFYETGMISKYYLFVSKVPLYNSPITTEEIEVFKECFE